MRKIAIFVLTIPFILFGMSDKDLANAINLAGKERMLTQKMSKEALLIFIGIDVNSNAKKLKATSSLFEKSLKGLRDGDKELNLVKSGDKEIEKSIDEAQKLWIPFKKRVENVASFKDITDETFRYIDKQNIPLLKKMNDITILYTKLNSSKSSKLKMANDINLAGKERMLTQMIAKDILLYQAKIREKKALKSLNSSVKLFDDILNGLYNGDKNLNLVGTKLPKIVKALDSAKKSWQESKELIEKSLKDRDNQDLLKELISKLDNTKSLMNRAVELYAKSINRQKQVMKLNMLISGFMQKKDNSKHLINLAGKQRMLSQRVAKLAIECKLKIIPDSCNNLIKYLNLYEKTLNGFLNGDSELKLSKVRSKEAIEQIKKIKEIWKPFKEAAIKVQKSQGKDNKAMSVVSKLNTKLLKESDLLVSILEKNSSKNLSYIEKAQLRIVNIAGRQRMLSQKMTKELLEYQELGKNKAKESMQKSIALFDKSLNGLINGSKEFKLPKATNKSIKEQLGKVSKLWSKIEIIYRQKKIPKKEMQLLLKVNPILLKELNKSVKIIEKSTDY